MISVKHLSKIYGNLTVLKDVNAEIQKGEVISIIGPSGTGKSTFLRCLNLLETPTSGEILIDGINVLDKKADISKLRQKMGMVFQSFNLFSHLMIIENIMLGPTKLLDIPKKDAFDEGLELLKMVGLSEKAYAYPDELSGGQKQRVAIARTLAMHPDIVLFDEPTSALDPTMVSEVLAVIRNLAQQGMTMAIVTHEMKFARDVSSRIFYMDEGIIYEDGPPEQIFENPQREKTREFIYKVRKFQFEIRSHNFDLYALNGELETFCQKHALKPETILSVQSVIEETVTGCILPLTNPEDNVNIDISMGYSEQDESISTEFKWLNGPDNIFETDNDDLLVPLSIINMRINGHEFKCENREKTIKLYMRT